MRLRQLLKVILLLELPVAKILLSYRAVEEEAFHLVVAREAEAAEEC
jgi:hypothetical protein